LCQHGKWIKINPPATQATRRIISRQSSQQQKSITIVSAEASYKRPAPSIRRSFLMNQKIELELPADALEAFRAVAARQNQTPAQWLTAQLQFLPATQVTSPSVPAASRDTAEREKAQQLAEQLTPLDLPIGVYIVTTDGHFIKCHEKVRDLLRLPKEGDIEQSIVEFYSDPAHREDLKDRLAQAERISGGKQWVEKEVLAFEVEGRKVFVQDYTRSLQDPETQQTIGYICCMVDITAEENYRRLFEQLPIGVYHLDEQDRIVRVNQAFYEILGYSLDSELKGSPAQVFYADEQEAAEFRQKVEKEGKVVNQKVHLHNKDGVPLTLAVSAFKLEDANGGYAGRIGTMTDVTNEERYRRILDDVPVGLYEVHVMNGEGLITHCNQQFADLMEFSSRQEVIGTPVKDLHASEEDYGRFMQALKRSFRRNELLLNFSLKARSRRGREMFLAVSSRPQGDKEGDNFNRVGAAHDITEETELRQRVEKVTKDIGAILHAYESSLIKVKNSTRAILDSLGEDPFERGLYLLPAKAAEALADPARRLAASLAKLLEAANAGERSAVLPADKWEELERLLRLLHNYHKAIPHIEAYPSTLRELALKVINLQAEIWKGNFPREPARQLKDDGRELLRVCNLISLHQIRDVIVDMDYPLEAVRRYVVSGVQKKEERKVRKVAELISLAISRLEEFAANRGVQLRPSVEPPNLLIEVLDRDVLRALGNLLHNAIKYSWARPGGPLWVAVRARRVNQFVHIEVENWGVPIPRREIEQGHIFALGHRGAYSSDRGRVGTGIGLHDAHDVALAHGGVVTIKSVPANPHGLTDDYNQPFLTTAVLRLPLYSR
jgi:PAS domain S-box-containing protein